jgi:thiol-disulfide isomerase/thioredoxin
VTLSRVNAVKASRDSRDLEKWCDRLFTPADAPRLALPATEVVGKQVAGLSLSPPRFIWLNLWATWCKPCVREMPMLKLWQQQLSKLGQPFDLWFVSVDQEKAELDKFLLEHPDLAAVNTLRITSADAMEPWFKSLGVNAMASVPIHILVAPGGAVRCVRTGSLNDGDFSLVKNLVR